jgi:bud site selection protein 20
MAAHGCIPCSRYFATPVALETHLTGKPHKRRLTKLKDEPYTIEESRRAVGLGVDNGSRSKTAVEVALAAAAEKGKVVAMEGITA